jgi:hypothetical protein
MNLRQIGQAIQIYANEHGGSYPESLRTVLLNEDIPAEAFVCPSSNDTKAPGSNAAESADHLETRGHCSHIYLGRGLTTGTVVPTTLLAYEPASNHEGTGGNARFGDGHVEFVGATQLAAIIPTTAP